MSVCLRIVEVDAEYILRRGGGFGMNTGKGSIICRGGRIFEVLDMNRTLHANYSYSKIINYSAFLIK